MKSNRCKAPYLLTLLGIVWLSVLVKGFTILAHEEFTAVRSTLVVTGFPSGSAIPLAADKPTLVIFFHPQCPCSRASLRELDEILAHTQGKLSPVIVFTIPKGEPAGWEKTDLWKSASEIPGAVVLRDPAGVEAKRFGVKGSGHTLLFDRSGKLLFSGGITPSRGHEGDNPGSVAIVSFVLSGNGLVSQTPVFGCTLL